MKVVLFLFPFFKIMRGKYSTLTSISKQNYVLLLILLTHTIDVQTFDFGLSLIGAGAGGAAVGGAYYYNLLSCWRGTSCCPSFNEGNLRQSLSHELFGQHIVTRHVISAVVGHMRDERPPHALSLVFVGSTGTGKTLVSSLIAESIHSEGRNSKFVHMFSGRLHFPLDSQVLTYQHNLKEWIHGNVSICPQSVFIFDEIDKVPANVIDAIKPFLDYDACFNSVCFNKAVFIFLTNLGSYQINQKYRALLDDGTLRDEMLYQDFESELRKSLYEANEGMFKASAAIKSHVISLYLPFLPLEKDHVRKCILHEFARRQFNRPSQYVDKILQNVEFYNDLWSVSGCKRVADYVSIMY